MTRVLAVAESTKPRVLRRAAPLLCGCALAAGAVLVAANDPAAAGSRFPGCIFHQTTGLWCPGCGLTRGLHQLLNGAPWSAITYNLFTPVVVLAIVWAWLSWLRTSWGRSALALPASLQRTILAALPVMLVLYGVLRNIPGEPFRALAP